MSFIKSTYFRFRFDRTTMIDTSKRLCAFTKLKSKTNKEVKYQNCYIICTFPNVLLSFQGPWSDKRWELPSHVVRVRSGLAWHNNMNLFISPTCIADKVVPVLA